MRVVVGITGASGAPYAVTLLENLNCEIDLVISDDAAKVLENETDVSKYRLEKLATSVYDNHDLAASISSGSTKFDAMVIVPCSSNTLAKIAHGLADNLITRVAVVALKERRKLILVPRETPLSQVYLENLLKVSQIGAIVLPASPGFYHRPKSAQDLVDFVVGRILDQLGLPNKLSKAWKGAIKGR